MAKQDIQAPEQEETIFTIPVSRLILWLSLAAGAMVLVNSVILVRGMLGLSEVALAWTMFAFGTGSMAAALLLPRLLSSWYQDQ